jgi:ElaB/YqjD/DUF883 family membrane-anchored ribosome-binding protein
MNNVSTTKIVSDFKVLLDDAEELLKMTTNQAGEKVAATRKRIEQSLEDGKKTLYQAEDVLMNKGLEAVKTSEDYIRHNPWNAVGIAAGVGLILGLLIRR